MYTVTIQMDYFGKCSEMLPEDSINAENLVRELVEHILLEFFSTVAIDRVSIHALPAVEEEDQRFSVSITAHCMSNAGTIALQELTLLELMLEDRIGCTLLELVGMIEMEDVSIVNPAMQEERMLSYHS